MSNTPMSDTQEKQTQEIYRVMQLPYLSERHDGIKQLIDSAKREVLEEVKKDSIAISLHVSIGYDDVVLVEDIDNRIAQLQEQSGGEKNE